VKPREESRFTAELNIRGSTDLLPSGKHTKNYGKSPFITGKSSINDPFSIATLNYQRVLFSIFQS
jgi:hypothetical protein